MTEHAPNQPTDGTVIGTTEGKVEPMTIHTTPETSATQRAQWRSHDGMATAAVTLSSEVDHRGARGWAYELSAGVPNGVGFHYTFARPSELIYTPGNPTPLEVLVTLSSFVGAWREAVEYGVPTYGSSENSDLFPRSCEPFLAYAEEFECDLMVSE